MGTGGRRTARRATTAVTAAVLAACSSGADDTGAGSAAPQTVPAATAPAMLPIIAQPPRPTTQATAPATGVATTVPPAPTTTAAPTTAAPTTTTTMPPPAPAPPVASLPAIPMAWRPVTSLPKLTAMASRPDGLIVMTSQTGEVWKVDAAGGSELVLDLTSIVSPSVNGSDRGLLDAAFDPTGQRLYLSYTDANADSHLVSYAVGPDGHLDPASVHEVLFVDQPGFGQKRADIAVAPDGMLFLALGDGGASNGRDAQDDSKLLGKVIRIMPRTDGPGYDVPPDNPFVGQPGVAPEIWATGLRNPSGLSRDPGTGDLWTGDAGNRTMEEIDRIPAGTSGQNFGWYWIEGTFVRVRGGAPPDVVAPVYAYRHDAVGPAVVGGRTYRGTAIPGLDGAYVFGDVTGVLFAIGAGDETVRLPANVPGVLTGFGTGPDGELWALTLDQGAFQLVPG
jgi:glucose/arabinose dehydrogenase